METRSSVWPCMQGQLRAGRGPAGSGPQNSPVAPMVRIEALEEAALGTHLCADSLPTAARGFARHDALAGGARAAGVEPKAFRCGVHRAPCHARVLRLPASCGAVALETLLRQALWDTDARGKDTAPIAPLLLLSFL